MLESEVSRSNKIWYSFYCKSSVPVGKGVKANNAGGNTDDTSTVATLYRLISQSVFTMITFTSCLPPMAITATRKCGTLSLHPHEIKV